MAELRPLLISFILIGIFSVALINFVYFAQVQNNANTTILDDDTYGLNDYRNQVVSNISKSYDDTLAADNSTSSSQVTFNFGSPFLDAINGVWKTMKAAPILIYELVVGLGKSAFLSGPETLIIIIGIATILTITIIFAVWKMIATGDAG